MMILALILGIQLDLERNSVILILNYIASYVHHRPGSAPKLIYRSIKAGSSAQKQIIQPTSTVATVATSSVATKSVSSSVFSRLGKQPSSGSKVRHPPSPFACYFISPAAILVGRLQFAGKQCGAC